MHRTCLEGSCHYWNPRPCELRCVSQGWPSCSYRKCPQGGSTFSCDPLVPGGKQSEDKLAFWAVKQSEICLRKQERSWASLFSPPKASHTKGPCRVIPSVSTVHCRGCLGARRQHSQGGGGLSWDPQLQQIEASWILPWNSSGPWFYVGLLSQPDRAHKKTLKTVQLRVPCQAVSTRCKFKIGTNTSSASRDGIASQVMEVAQNTIGTAFLPFSLTSCQYYLKHCPFAIVWLCQAQPPHSGVKSSPRYLLLGTFCLRRSSRVVSITSSSIF